MEAFRYRGGELFCEDVPVARVAGRVGTPFYLYSQSSLENQFREFDGAFRAVPHLTCYAVKANSNLAILSLFRRLGAGFDIVSRGELMRAFRAGADPKKIIFSGVGKTGPEIDLALRRGIMQFNVESAAELEILEARAHALDKTANFALRVNPDIDAYTHPYISTGRNSHKFGIPAARALEIYQRVLRSPHLRITGISCHIGSQITAVEPFVAAVGRLKEIFLGLRRSGVDVHNFDVGGGLGITYNDETPPEPAAYASAMMAALRGLDCKLILEPGRVIAATAGILVTRVLLAKQTGSKNFVVVDAGMSDLIRPSLYGSYHRIQPLVRTRRRPRLVDVVGPICESGDFFAQDRLLPAVKTGDLLAVMSAGAYGFVLSSNYNSRLRAPEALVRRNRFKVIRRRETFQDLIRGESHEPF